MTKPELANLALWGEANAYHEGRAYRDPRDGRHYPSITTILKLVDKQIGQYAAEETLKWAVQNWSLLASKSDEEGMRFGRYRWKDHRDLRAEVGDGVHLTIEQEQTGGWDYPELDDEQQQIIEQWHLLNEKHKIEPILNEVTVANIEDGWFGTFDSYCLFDGKRALVDFKTSKSIHDEARMQLSALGNASEWFIKSGDMKWDVQDPHPIDVILVFHLRADKWEVIEVEDSDLHYDKFKKYAGIWYDNEALKNRAKSRTKELISW